MAQLWRFGSQHDFNQSAATEFFENYWHYSLYISAFYVVTIFGIKKYMEDKPKYDLRTPLMCWSLLLAVFSIVGTYMTSWKQVNYLLVHGWKASVCDPIIVYGQAGFWGLLFCLSKAPELLDTYFIVLRKQKLIFLHWYHHITVFVCSWYVYCLMTHIQQWFCSMNFFVHSLMYTYYAVRASRLYKIPVWVNMFITVCQLLQMAIGVAANSYVFINMTIDPLWYCNGRRKETYKVVFLAFTIYSSYLVLFGNFFYKSYISKKPAKAAKKSISDEHNKNGETSGISELDKPYLNAYGSNAGTLKRRAAS